MSDPKVDWDYVHRCNFEMAAFSANKWIATARNLFESAKRLEPEVMRVWENYRKRAKNRGAAVVPDHFQGTYFMLLAFATENLLKAAAISRNGSQYRAEFSASKKFPSELRDHDLANLAILVGLSYSVEEEDLLRRLTRSAIWFGRYPAPLKYAVKRYKLEMRMIIIIEIIALCWVGYNGWRVFSSHRNSVNVGAEVQAECPHDFAFQTYLKVREYYLKLSPAHEKYEVSGNDLMKDAVIDVWETAGFQSVKHKYRVAEIKTNERMKLVSEKSNVKTLGLFKGESRSEVEFRFQPAADGKTNLGLTIQIVFPNWFRHFMARLFFTEAIWNSHALEEMNALARIMEQQFHTTKSA